MRLPLCLIVTLVLGACSKTKEESAPTAATPAPVQRQDPSSDLCGDLKATIEAKIDRSQGCEKDEDCQIVWLGCPFGCGTALSTATEVETIKSDITEMEKSCGKCLYKCQGGERKGECKDGRCEMAFTAE